MPGELKDPENMFPFHYESLYNNSGNSPNSMELPNVDKYIETIARDSGIRLNLKNLKKLNEHLEQKGLLYRNMGDESFKNEVVKFLKKISCARKVAQKWLI